MKSFKWNRIQSLKATVQDLFGEEDPILLEFDVVPFEYKVADLSSCKFYVSMNKLALTVDDLIEIYELKDLNFAFIGKEPQFGLLEQLLEYNITLDSDKFPLPQNIDIPDDFFRFTMHESNGEPKQFTLRKGSASAKAFQTWGMVETIKKLREDDEDLDLYNMVYGNFSAFDPQMVFWGFIVFFVYVFISVVLGGILPDLLKSMLDVLFASGCLFFVGWMVWSMHLSTQRYAKIYEKYKHRSAKKTT